MLPKKHRLTKHADVNITTAKGRGFFSKSFVIKFLVKTGMETPQIVVVASNKVSKSAVVRNRLKRIIRQSLHDLVSNLKPGFYVFILKQTAIAVKSQDLKEELIESLKKSKILK